ncbi:ATP-dependent nuclease [Burkholderia pyrrocinia]|uniref:ATP-dependent nuclease n=1 Tax=Burkholderia pyrrocinia TaxID=60550 RepID=UPI001BCF27F7|nr:AAA family ATPase [Burkholderia pyrrocinia]QVN18588.1 AAA family ATPase [Burkholderia pyrrocinia]
MLKTMNIPGGNVTTRSKLVRMTVRNIGCIGNEGITVELDDIVCLVGRNNSGKSTILRAYELAKGAQSFDIARDRCQSAADDQPSEIELEAHIPKNIGNVHEKWKIERDALLIVRSRWQWAAPDFQRSRSTWDPEIDNWAEDGKAGGADPVFNSRLPRVLRIGSLDDAESTESKLLTLALTPLLAVIEQERAASDSPLAKALASVIAHINGLSADHQDHFNKIAEKVTEGFKGIFPKLDVRLNIAAAPWAPKIEGLVKEGSGLRIKDGKADTSLVQQGTGAQRALFWAMLQVHNELTRDRELREAHGKRLAKELADEKKAQQKAGANLDKLAEIEARIAAFNDGGAIPESPDDPAFPGYLLLIDEPENALHPMAARAAQRHLYKLAESADWQVMMTTHSPYFINPLVDHTTIIRLERGGEDNGGVITPKTYRSDFIEFQGDEKKRLQALQHVDPSLAEIFFGSYPIVVEGDTEHAAFIASILERQHDHIDRVTVVRARGKAILVPLIRVLTHFKMDFGVVHDADPPFKRDGTANGMWSENAKIRDEILKARAANVAVRHRVSVPDFERYLGGDEVSKDKPLNAYLAIKEDGALGAKVQGLLSDLLNSAQHEPFANAVFASSDEYMERLKGAVDAWATANGLADRSRFKGTA